MSGLYFSGAAGAVQSNYFVPNLVGRGLLDSYIGPPLKSFPFYEDASVIWNAMRTFMGSFVDSYYSGYRAISQDFELQAWLSEANGPAEVIDFPTNTTLTTPSDLADLLTHVAHLVSTAHHAVNLNQLLTGSGVLPFQPFALYQPLPTTKGATNLAQYLPPAAQVYAEIGLAAVFAHPLLAGTNRSIIHMFDDTPVLALMNQQTREANTRFMQQMKAQSEVVASRKFDSDGLSQGMPFVWQALDPNVVPWSVTT